MKLNPRHLMIGLMLTLYLSPLIVSLLVSFSNANMLALPTEFSVRWYTEFWNSSRWTMSLWRSIYIAVGATAIVLPISLGLAWSVWMKAPFARFFEGLAMVPLLLPPVVLALASLPVVQQTGLWGHPFSLMLYHAIWALPVVFLILRDGLNDIGKLAMDAAYGLGASDVQAFTQVVLPLLKARVIVAIVVSLVLSTNEFMLALFIGTAQTETLPRVIWPSLRYTLTPLVAAASAVALVGATAATLFFVNFTGTLSERS